MTVLTTPSLRPEKASYPPTYSEPLTEEQNSALATVRSQVKEIVPSTFTEHEQAYAINWLTDACLRRYLVAHKWNVENAVKGLKDTVTWRKEYGVDSITPEEVRPESVTGCNYFNGFDKAGRPIIYLKKRAVSENPELNVRLLVYSIETAINAMPEGIGKLHIIMDFTHYTRANSPPLHISRLTLTILQSHYPERLGRIHMMNSPRVFSFFWSLFSPFVDPITRDKIRFVTWDKTKTFEKGGKNNSPVLEDIDVNVLEKDYGGKSEFTFDHDLYWKTAREVGLL
ncbi:hypothetical protein HDV00_005441 [Rhizophlyctis rosea]|nr:hypothetical protein HDV00_005441 [Rhizophlyctis rosea]